MEHQPALIEKMGRGEFSLRDMKNQFESILKMGPVSQVMDMIPGMKQLVGSQPGGAGGVDDGSRRLQRLLYMLDSMTEAELDGLVGVHSP